MTKRNLYCSIAGVSNIISVEGSEGYKNFCRSYTIQCESTTKQLGDSISIDLGFDDHHGTIFTGYVKDIRRSTPDNTYTLTCFDELVKSNEMFLAYMDEDSEFVRTNIDATDLVEDLLNEAQITSFTGSASSFIFTEPRFNLVSVSDAINQVANIIAWHIWADETGTIHFAERLPYPTGGDSATHTFTTGDSGNIVTSQLDISDKELRNKVVIYGAQPIYATASAVSPYLPAGYYKTAVIASPLITSQSMAQDAANYNLALYNILTQQASLEALGDYTLHVNDIVTVTEAHTGISGDWFVYSINHAWGQDGYTMRLGLRK